MIWREPLLAPQLHIMGEDRVSMSSVNMVMQSCKEARTQGLLPRLLPRLPYYVLNSTWEGNSVDLRPPSESFYINSETATILLTEGCHFPYLIQSFCSICLSELLRDTECECPHWSEQTGLSRLAVYHQHLMHPPRTDLSPVAVANSLIDRNAQGLFILMGDPMALEEDVRFRGLGAATSFEEDFDLWRLTPMGRYIGMAACVSLSPKEQANPGSYSPFCVGIAYGAICESDSAEKDGTKLASLRL